MSTNNTTKEVVRLSAFGTFLYGFAQETEESLIVSCALDPKPYIRMNILGYILESLFGEENCKSVKGYLTFSFRNGRLSAKDRTLKVEAISRKIRQLYLLEMREIKETAARQFPEFDF